MTFLKGDVNCDYFGKIVKKDFLPYKAKSTHLKAEKVFDSPLVLFCSNHIIFASIGFIFP